MSTLVGYGSSDDEDGESRGFEEASGIAIFTFPAEKGIDAGQAHSDSACPTPTIADDDGSQKALADTGALQSKLVGAQPPPVYDLHKENATPTSSSLYSTNRAAIRNLTMPATPNFDIPPSPRGSPPPVMEQKFDHFARLKEQGVHFNEKLAASSALKNPALLHRLMSSAGLDNSNQYTTMLSKDLWDPSAFPDWAYKDELAKSQQQIAKKDEKEKLQTQRVGVDFVASSSAESPANGDGTVSMSKIKGSRASTAVRVAAEFGGQTVRSRYTSNGGFRDQLERQSSRVLKPQPRPRSLSPRRK
ncbi:MAG: hypothetical protein Q9207_000580 [Kuettlingeria erythrocarpa]